MNILRQNTDYALRAMVNLAQHYGNGAVSTRVLAEEGDIAYQFSCKILQRLHGARLVQSSMGPKGGFRLCRRPGKITLLEIIEAIQGPISLSNCLLGADACPREPICPVSKKLAELQKYIENFLGKMTLQELLESKGRVNRKHKKTRIKRNKY